MRMQRRWHVSAMVMAATVAWAEEPTTPAFEQAGGDITCRHVTTTRNGAKTEQDYCGTPAQWAEFDRRVAQLKKPRRMPAFSYDESSAGTNVNNSWSVGTGQMTDILIYSGQP